MRKLITLILIVLLAGCTKAEDGPGASFEDVDIDAIYESLPLYYDCLIDCELKTALNIRCTLR